MIVISDFSRSLKSEYVDRNNSSARTTNGYGFRLKPRKLDLLAIEHPGVALTPSQLKVLSALYPTISKHGTISWMIK